MTSTPLRITVLCLGIGLLGACHPRVGGPCTYTGPVAGQVVVEEVGDHYVVTRITQLDIASRMQPGDELVLPLPRENGARDVIREGDTRDVVLNIRETGSCVPVQAEWAQEEDAG